ncbi:MAG: histidinol-phosphate aminotransferase, partial [Solirubrobacteraceae bacterium]|nr:histidinol-phosphate aminotransferase [Solirubrobacteraceae bacterium]
PVPDGEDTGEVEAAVLRGLAERGVIVRAGGALGKPGALRVTYGTPGQNRRFLRALRELI